MIYVNEKLLPFVLGVFFSFVAYHFFFPKSTHGNKPTVRLEELSKPLPATQAAKFSLEPKALASTALRILVIGGCKSTMVLPALTLIFLR